MTAPTLMVSLSFGGINGMIIGLILKQGLVPFAFLQIQKLAWRKT
jgi:hypothetical protein